MNSHTRTRGRISLRALIPVALVSLTVAGVSIAQASTGAVPAAPGTTAAVHYKLSVSARQHVLSGRGDLVKGSIAPKTKGRTVLVQAKGARGGWHTVARVHTSGRGRFAASWKPHGIGRYEVRAKLLGTSAQHKARTGVTVYRTSYVSWYGPGFYGHRTACGGTLSPGTQGVANKSLPCGTKVTLHYRDSTVTVPVIDRGPYVAGREYDLTGATKSRLHFGSTGTLWSSPHRRK
ncbi:MAG: rare lipoprotein [Thermoleophilaceae bacterium]|nr:rare lipoprotein [Thermoleophilaceae bacterium]